MKKFASILTAGLIIAAMAIPAFAEEGTGFVSSIEQKPAPDVQSDTTVTIDGEEVAVDNLSDLGVELVVTPISEKESAPNSDITDGLTSAFNEISKTNDAEIVFSSDDDQAAFTQAKEDAASRGKTLVASNIFDISLVDIATKENVDVDGITVTLAVDNADDLVLVMHRPDDTWEVVPFVNNGDGTITLTLSSLSPLALFVEADLPADTDTDTDTGNAADTGDDTPASTDGGKVTSPDTGVESGNILLVSAIVVAAAAVVCVIRAKKA